VGRRSLRRIFLSGRLKRLSFVLASSVVLSAGGAAARQPRLIVPLIRCINVVVRNNSSWFADDFFSALRLAGVPQAATLYLTGAQSPKLGWDEREPPGAYETSQIRMRVRIPWVIRTALSGREAGGALNLGAYSGMRPRHLISTTSLDARGGRINHPTGFSVTNGNHYNEIRASLSLTGCALLCNGPAMLRRRFLTRQPAQPAPVFVFVVIEGQRRSRSANGLGNHARSELSEMEESALAQSTLR